MHENFDAIQMQLSADDIKQISNATSQVEVQGTRYSAAAMEALAKS
jgi:diketogulonate reductase-like aldo/keto reductase